MSRWIEDNKSSVLVAMLLAWMAWLSVMVIGMKSDMAALQLLQANVIPPVVEGSFKELREKGNEHATSVSKLTEIAGRNAQDIGYIKEQIATLKKP